ncbi:MAG: sulfite exporter TauE/SafE family protein [Gammaproteobacteria bacterium]|nr:sulfite exporter TauE/SafE family protein [Gammaproteobacteria bacterium]
MATGVIIVGAVLQAATGMGTGILIVPLLALINLDLVPGPTVMASVALSLPMAWSGRRHISYGELKPLMSGLLVGCAVGALGLASIPAERVGIAFAAAILVTVTITSLGVRLPFNHRSLVSVGVIAGVMGATSGVGAPPIALLYQHRTGPELRPTLAFVYTASSAIILVFLMAVGRFWTHETGLALWLVPGYVLGYLLATPLAGILDRGYSRVAVLALSTVSAVILLFRSL